MKELGKSAEGRSNRTRSAATIYAFASALVTLLVIALVAWSLWQDRRQLETDAALNSRNTARLLESSVAHSFDKIDLSLRMVVAFYHEQSVRGSIDEAGLAALLEELQAAQPEIESLRIINAQGIARLGRGVPTDKPVGFADRDYFRTLRDQPGAGLVVSQPTFGRITRKWSIALARRLETADGRFAGIVTAILTTRSFEMMMSHLDLGRQSIATLRYADGALVYRYPPPANLDRLVGDKRVSAPLARVIREQAAEAQFVSTAPVDGVERSATVRRVGRYPLYVSVGIATQNYLLPWRAGAIQVGAFVLFIIALSGALVCRLYQASRRMQDAEARWHFALEGSDQGVWDWDLPGGKVFFSPRYKRMLGFADLEFGNTYDEWATRVHPDDLAPTTAAYERHLRGEAPVYDAEYRMRHKDGGYRWMHARGMVIERAADGQPKRMIGTQTDVSARRATAEALRALTTTLEQKIAERTADLNEALLRLKLATDAADVGIWVWRWGDNRLLWDDRMYRWYQVPAELREKGIDYEFWRGRLVPEDRARVEQALDVCRKEGRPLDTTFRMLLPDGSLRVMQAAAVFDLDEQGAARGMVGVNRDITAQRELEAHLIAAREAAEAGNLTKSRFLANMSHEIRTPLNAMIGLASVLLEEADTPRRHDYLSKLQSAGNVLLGLLNDILDHSKIEAGLMSLEAVPLSLARIVDNARSLFGAQAAEKQLALQFDLSPALPEVVVGDALRLQQVVNNLVGNALKFTERGAVSVSLACAEKTAESVMLKVTVRDTGIGMTDEQVSRLFAPFQQADPSTTRRYGGSGLGLSIAKRLIELMSGEIGVTSAPGVGSTFWFTAKLGLWLGETLEAAALPRLAPPAKVEHIEREADIACLLPQLAELAKLLASGQASARECSAQIQSQLQATALAPRFAPIHRAIGRFDFDGAGQALDQLACEEGWSLEKAGG